MADFSVDLAQPQGRGASPIAPVQTGNTILPMISSAVNIFAKGLGEKKKEEAAAHETQIVGDYTRTVAAINDGLAQGTINDSEASMRSRAEFNKFAAQYPQYTESFKKTSQAFRSESQLGEALEEEQSWQDLRRGVLKDMASSGILISPNAGGAYVEAEIASFQANRLEQARLDNLIKMNAEERAQGADARSLRTFEQKQQVMSTLSQIGSQKFQAASSFVQDIGSRLGKGEDPAQLVNEVNMYFGNIEAAISQVGTYSPESIGPLRTTFESLKNVGLDLARGTETSETVKRKLEDFKNQITYMVLESNPTAQALYVGSNLTQGNIAVTATDANLFMRDLLLLSQEGGGLNTPSILGDRGAGTLALGKDRMAQIRSGRISPDGAQEMGVVNNNILDQIASTPPDKLTPALLKDAAAYIASPEFKDIHVKGGFIDTVVAKQAYDVMQLVYEREIAEAVTEKLSKPWGNHSKIGDAVDVEFTGAGVTFKKREAGYEIPAIRFERERFTRDFQSSQKAINQLIHMGAHLEGHDNYQKYWEENKHILMPSKFPNPEIPVLTVGQVVDGYRYKGGGNVQENWELVDEAEETRIKGILEGRDG